jgi:hypothetical protein
MLALVFASLLSCSPVHAAEAVRLENLVATEEVAVPEAEFEASLAAFAATRGTRGENGGGGNRPNWMTSGNRPNWYTSSNRPDWVTAGNRPNWLTAGSRPNWYTGHAAFDAEGASYPEPTVAFEE